MTNIEHVHGGTDGRRGVADGRMPVIRTARLLPAFVRFKDPGDYQTRVMMNAVCSDHFIMTQIFLTLVLISCSRNIARLALASYTFA